MTDAEAMARDFALRRLKARDGDLLAVVDVVSWLDMRGAAIDAIVAAMRLEPRTVRQFAGNLAAIAEYVAVLETKEVG